jgi:imidazole glycerol phosphate synthase glutamine amidotransferase subunit
LNVAICEYGAGNVRSVARAAMEGLAARGLDDALRERVAAGRPTLGICLGLQLALEWTEEDGGVEGLGLLPGQAVRLRDGRVPRIGWAPVDGSCGGDAFYFAHSYAAETPHATAWSEGIVAEARAGSFVGVQFHPEKSGAAGARYLAAVLDECLSRV